MFESIKAMLTAITISLIIAASPYIDSKADLNIAYRIVEAEATGGTIQQKMNVTSCLLARINSKGFPDTIEAVVFEKGQFTPIIDKRYYSVTVTEDTKKAVNRILINGPEHNCTYFCTSNCESYKSGFHSRLKEEFYDGVHHYFTE